MGFRGNYRPGPGPVKLILWSGWGCREGAHRASEVQRCDRCGPLEDTGCSEREHQSVRKKQHFVQMGRSTEIRHKFFEPSKPLVHLGIGFRTKVCDDLGSSLARILPGTSWIIAEAARTRGLHVCRTTVSKARGPRGKAYRRRRPSCFRPLQRLLFLPSCRGPSSVRDSHPSRVESHLQHSRCDGIASSVF